MNTTTQLTADQQYSEHQNAILDLLDELRSELGMHEVHFDRTGRRHWGYPGDLGHVREILQEARDFMTNNQE